MQIDQRVLDFERLGLGVFIHLGAYSKYEYGEWAQDTRKMDKVKYKEEALAEDYSSFDASNIIGAAKAVGAKYITLTTRHHDGFSLFDTKGLSDYDIMHTPNGRDIVAEFCDKCRKEDIVPFLYHTTLDWDHPDFENNFPRYLEYLQSSVEILCSNYGEIGGIWFDGNWSKPNEDWKLDDLYGMIRANLPNAIIINNTGLEAHGVMGHKEIDVVTFEQGKPNPIDFEKAGKYVSGEVCLPLNEHWAIGHDINFKSMRQIIEMMAACRKQSANMLLGIGINADSTVPLMPFAMLTEIGKWIKIHKIPYFDGKPCKIKGYNDDFALQTDNGDTYLFVFGITTWGDENVMTAKAKSYCVFEGINQEIQEATWLDSGEAVEFIQDMENQLFTIKPTQFKYGSSYIVRVAKLVKK